MDDKTKKRKNLDVENKLNEFFINKERISYIEKYILELNNDKTNLENQIKNLDINFNEINIKANIINDMPSSSFNNSSYFETEMIKQIEKMEKFLNDIDIKIFNLQNEKLLLSLKNEKLNMILNMLNTSYQKLIFYRYNLNNLSELEISNKLNISVSHYHRKKRKH